MAPDKAMLARKSAQLCAAVTLGEQEQEHDKQEREQAERQHFAGEAMGQQRSNQHESSAIRGGFAPLGYGACDSQTSSQRALQNGAEQQPPLASKRARVHRPSHAEDGPTPSTSSASSMADDHQDYEEEPLKGQHRPSAIERLSKRVPGLGVMLALCASVFLGTAGMLVKLTQSVHGIQVAVFRALIQVLIYSVIISGRRMRWLPERGERVHVGLRALLGGTSITFSYYALKLIPLGDATTIRFSLPIWTLIAGYFLLGEACNLYKVSAVIISVCGVVLIAKPNDCIYLAHLLLSALGLESLADFRRHKLDYDNHKFEEAPALFESANEDLLLVGANGTALAGVPVSAATLRQFEGCSMALASSICLSLSMIAVRLCKRTPAEITILWLSVFSVFIGTTTLLLLGEWRLPDNLRDVAYILLNGLCGSIGQWFITSAFKVEQSGIISLARTFDIEIAFLYSALLLNEEIRTTSIVGSVLVSLGVIIVVVPKWLSESRVSDGNNNTGPTADLDAPIPNETKSTILVGGTICTLGEPEKKKKEEPIAVNVGRP